MSHNLTGWVSQPEIEARVCDIASEQLGIRRAEVHPGLRIIQDLHCDSLDLVELFMEIENEFDVALPGDAPNPAYKVVFTRDQIRLRDLAELVYLQQGSGHVRGRSRFGYTTIAPARDINLFTQLSGKAAPDEYAAEPLYEKLGKNSQNLPTFRRRTDGMVCVQIPAAEVEIGSGDDRFTDEAPAHRVELGAFLMDQETVSVVAYCRFLNSIGPVAPAVLREWFMLTPDDKRREHELVRQDEQGDWSPLRGTQRLPMILVSWYGANAYSLWANRGDWLNYSADRAGHPENCFLPSEAQWEYAARGPLPREFPWGDGPAEPWLAQFARHTPSVKYRPDTLPMASVNTDLGVSPFGVRHMAGNVWQWCRDWYAPEFYRSAQAMLPNAVNKNSSAIRSERGGSWVGPAFLCRSSYRRGRAPEAKGRCLGFRCVGALEPGSP